MAENKKDIKKSFFTDIVPRIACVLVAIVIWLYAVYNSNPNYEKNFDGIPVTLLFSDMLDDRGLTLYGDVDESLEVVIYGKRGNITTYSKDDIRATASLIGVTEEGRHTVNITVEAPDGATVKSYYPKEIEVTVEKLEVKSDVPVEVKPTFTTAYVGGEAHASVPTVTVKGPSAELLLVDHVEARPTFEKELTTSMTSVGVPLVACTSDGSVLDSEYISIEPATVDVEIPLYDEREIPITVKQTNPDFAQIIDSITVYPNTLKVRRKINGGITLGDVSELVIGEIDERDLTGLSRNEKLVLPVTLPESYESLSDFDKVTVSIGYRSTTISAVFNCKNFKLDNPKNLNYLLKTDGLEVCVRLPASLAASLTLNPLAYSDFVFEGSLADLEDGKVPVTLNIPDEYEGQIYVVGSYFAEVDLKK